jgi:threonine dehydrogenase-like Zn-dependent dehydrogenase
MERMSTGSKRSAMSNTANNRLRTAAAVQAMEANMKGTVLYGPRDIRLEKRHEPKIIHPTDAIIRIAAYAAPIFGLTRGINKVNESTPMGHKYCGVVEEVGRQVKLVKPGQFVIGSFFASDNTCPHCRHHGSSAQWVGTHSSRFVLYSTASSGVPGP